MTATADETQPLLLRGAANPAAPNAIGAIGAGSGTAAPQSAAGSESTVVDFDPCGDRDNPLEWPAAFKWSVVLMLAMTAFTVTFTCISVVPLANEISRDLGGDARSKAASVLLVTIWELGEAAGPLLIAPLSEMVGRYRVVNAANALFIVATLLAATSASLPQFVAARMLTGLAVATNVLSPAIVGDIFVSEQRGGALSLVFLAPLLGGAVGPAISGAIAERAGWRAVVWLSAGLAVLCELLFLTFFRETYKVTILRRRAARLARESGKPFRTEFDGEEESGSGSGGLGRLRDAMLRPVTVLAGSSVLAIVCLYGSICFAYYYVITVTLADILRDVYHLPPVQAGLCFITISLGSAVAVFACNRSLDPIYIRLRDANKGVGQPEHRLPVAIGGAFVMPATVAAYGWAAALHLPLPALLASMAALGAALMFTMIPLMAYVVDAFGLYSASAMTGVIVVRCLVGTFLPLATAPLVDNFGYGWGFTVFAALSFAIAPVPALVMRYGARWRQKSDYTRDQ
ncbi:major facilitator superfamily transporter [Lasiosphaeria miniovina]|uniref:Major facilitator superfamily transporter n=1 Tax=Lasiosphaeria miniovina TaxID=1954250 RepID=A0AA39ZUQ5_9PEZI|nr:major facilitator superfamily transporter [Lasiosphaeria miniovina]KAK0703890.1 major facilitator superfamily transporter [Lasiosphaeria miniovina]